MIIGMFRVYLFFSTCMLYTLALDSSDLVIVILSQNNEYHLKLAEHSKYLIQNETKVLKKELPVVHLSEIDFPSVGGWTILPLIPKLVSLHGHNSSWFIFIEDRTQLRLNKLLVTLSKYSQTEDIWLGYALYDEEATIIHHFAFFQDPKFFKYPNIASGFAITTKLLQKLAGRIKATPPKSDFSIDSSHELALFVWENGAGTALIHEPSFCIIDKDYCSVVPRRFEACDNLPREESLYFVVKTCSKFHKDRIPVVKKTWAIHTSKIKFFSDVRDEGIPTIDLGIPNTESGHCGKTMAILRYVAKELKHDESIRWVILADDDTIFSVPRLRKLLTCYNPASPIALGERYGYNLLAPEGYNYITGGGGIVFSRILVELLSQPDACECPTISSPDDMYLGICVARINGEIIHSPFFHQARPVDYSKDYLKTQMLISFHKHWNIDPISVYKNWLLDVSLPDYSIDHIEL